MEQIIEINNTTDTISSTEEKLITEAMKKVKDPFMNLTVEYVMKDLGIGIVKAYEIFNRNDFPSINVGKTKTVTLLAYLIWKMKRQEKNERGGKNGIK